MKNLSKETIKKRILIGRAVEDYFGAGWKQSEKDTFTNQLVKKSFNKFTDDERQIAHHILSNLHDEAYVKSLERGISVPSAHR